MDTIQFLEQIIFGERLEDKIQDYDLEIDFSKKSERELPTNPSRSLKIKLGGQSPFPKKKLLIKEEERARAIHFFANHELLAIEMMAYFLLKLKGVDSESILLKKRIFETLKDEQKHLKLYIDRINELGVEFGDFPLNDFLWRQTQNFSSVQNYFAIMAMTFESANLDFAKYYSNIFNEVSDLKSAEIMDVIYNDEISHVALGVVYLNKSRGPQDLWTYYCGLLPENFSPSRGKGIIFDEISRKKAGMDPQFIQFQKEYRDPYQLVNRKDWKK